MKDAFFTLMVIILAIFVIYFLGYMFTVEGEYVNPRIKTYIKHSESLDIIVTKHFFFFDTQYVCKDVDVEAVEAAISELKQKVIP